MPPRAKSDGQSRNSADIFVDALFFTDLQVSEDPCGFVDSQVSKDSCGFVDLQVSEDSCGFVYALYFVDLHKLFTLFERDPVCQNLLPSSV